MEVTQSYKLTPIGTIDRPYTGRDQFVEILCLEDDIDLDQANNWLFEHVYYDTEIVGRWFCNRVSIIPMEAKNRVIGVIHHEQNI